MSVEIKVPDLGEAGVEATVSRWLKQAGDAVKAGEAVVVLETDKVDLEVAAEADGVLESIERDSGEDVEIGAVLGHIDESAGPADTSTADDADETDPSTQTDAEPDKDQTTAQQPTDAPTTEIDAEPTHEKDNATPVAKRIASQAGIDLTKVQGSGPQGRVTRDDIERYQHEQQAAEDEQKTEKGLQPAPSDRQQANWEERRMMSRRRRTIARRLVEAQQTAAMLTTFNDVDMTAVMALRERRKAAFQERHGIKLGISSFFVKAVIGALKDFPELNAEIDGDEIVLKHYYDIGIAIGDEEGLVVPVLRDADRMSFADIESEIRRLAQATDEGKLSLDDLRGGTFTITNGGVFGSLLSTPILNSPQVGILGLHRIEDRPVAIDGEVVVRQMMYMALSYDHRIVDGREAVQFLGRVKAFIEDPEVLLIGG